MRRRRRRRRRTTTTTAPLERLHCIALTSSSLLVGPNNCLTHSFSPFPSFPSFTPSSVRLSNFLCFPFHEKEKKEGGKAGWLVGRSVNCGGRGTWSCKQCPFPTRPLSLSFSIASERARAAAAAVAAGRTNYKFHHFLLLLLLLQPSHGDQLVPFRERGNGRAGERASEWWCGGCGNGKL